MARSFSNAKLLSALVVDGFSKAITRRGYAAAASQGVVASRGATTGAARNVVNKSGEEMVAPNTDKVSWIPDPVTGYYRPGNRAQEIDVAELRAILLKKH
ncbi:hypothetical protein FNV43_RR23557 [Rhamnella rubrinervis]|uniref:Uncharacterized protein n=1 Tax=Rhamnella rubrinervis TaxID=2594499 RepID=A0A8K0GW33_9ROSA|nr:hypothetical protein FNV43_RR23557 [Rhamnella rubrinervis]